MTTDMSNVLGYDDDEVSRINEALDYRAARHSLNELMEFGRVVFSDGNGNVAPAEPAGWVGAEGIYADADADGQIIGSDADALHGIPTGFDLLTGFTGQYGYSGAIMHPSEYVGGGLARHIRQTAGYYVTLTVDTLPDDEDAESESAGWAIAYRAAEDVD